MICVKTAKLSQNQPNKCWISVLTMSSGVSASSAPSIFQQKVISFQSKIITLQCKVIAFQYKIIGFQQKLTFRLVDPEHTSWDSCEQWKPSKIHHINTTSLVFNTQSLVFFNTKFIIYTHHSPNVPSSSFSSRLKEHITNAFAGSPSVCRSIDESTTWCPAYLKSHKKSVIFQQNIDRFSTQNYHFSGAIPRHLCIFNRKFQRKLIFILQFATPRQWMSRACTASSLTRPPVRLFKIGPNQS